MSNMSDTWCFDMSDTWCFNRSDARCFDMKRRRLYAFISRDGFDRVRVPACMLMEITMKAHADTCARTHTCTHARTRQDKKKMGQLDVTKIKKEREMGVVKEEEEEELKSKTGGMVFTTTMEFCRNLQVCRRMCVHAYVCACISLHVCGCVYGAPP